MTDSKLNPRIEDIRIAQKLVLEWGVNENTSERSLEKNGILIEKISYALRESFERGRMDALQGKEPSDEEIAQAAWDIVDKINGFTERVIVQALIREAMLKVRDRLKQSSEQGSGPSEHQEAAFFQHLQMHFGDSAWIAKEAARQTLDWYREQLRQAPDISKKQENFDTTSEHIEEEDISRSVQAPRVEGDE